MRMSPSAPTPKCRSLTARLSAAGVRSLVSQPPTLEELFLRHYQTGDGQRTPEAGPR